jgi:hypothetical protein
MTNYGAFMFLNNAGLKLLENQLYQESIETFQDATDVYHEFCSQHDQQQHPKKRREPSISTPQLEYLPKASNNTDTSLQDIIIKASKRLSVIRSDDTNITLHPYDSELEPMIVLDTMDDYYFTQILKYEKSLDKVDVVIRMSDSSPAECIGSDWILYYAILIFNYGVACKRSSEVSAETYEFSDEYQYQLRDQSIQLFHASHRIVVDEIKEFTSALNNMRSFCQNLFHLGGKLYALSLSMFTSGNLRDMMYWTNSTEENTKYYVLYQKSYRFFQILVKEYMNPFGTNLTRHAAAA